MNMQKYMIMVALITHSVLGVERTNSQGNSTDNSTNPQEIPQTQQICSKETPGKERDLVKNLCARITNYFDFDYWKVAPNPSGFISKVEELERLMAELVGYQQHIFEKIQKSYEIEKNKGKNQFASPQDLDSAKKISEYLKTSQSTLSKIIKECKPEPTKATTTVQSFFDHQTDLSAVLKSLNNHMSEKKARAALHAANGNTSDGIENSDRKERNSAFAESDRKIISSIYAHFTQNYIHSADLRKNKLEMVRQLEENEE